MPDPADMLADAAFDPRDRMRGIGLRVFATLLGALLLTQPAVVSAGKAKDRIATLIAATDGASKARAFKVDSVDEEYHVLAALGLRPARQSLIIGDDRKPYDLIEATDAAGKPREIWFDVSKFYGKGF